MSPFSSQAQAGVWLAANADRAPGVAVSVLVRRTEGYSLTHCVARREPGGALAWRRAWMHSRLFGISGTSRAWSLQLIAGRP